MCLEQPSDFPLHIIVTFSNPHSGKAYRSGTICTGWERFDEVKSHIFDMNMNLWEKIFGLRILQKNFS